MKLRKLEIEIERAEDINSMKINKTTMNSTKILSRNNSSPKDYKQWMILTNKILKGRRRERKIKEVDQTRRKQWKL